MRFVKEKRPYYCEVEYIETKATSSVANYFKTNMYPTVGTSITMVVQPTDISVRRITGASDTQGNGRGATFVEVTSSGYWGCGAAGTIAVDTTKAQKVKIKFNSMSHQLYVDDVLALNFSLSIEHTTDPYEWSLGCNTAATTNRMPAKWYRAYQEDSNGNIMHDLIPVLDWDMNPAFYDRVTKRFFYKTQLAGTEDVSYGRQIHYVDYLVADGASAIDTLIKPQYNIKLESEVFVPFGGDDYFSSVRIDSGDTRFYLLNLNTTLGFVVSSSVWGGTNNFASYKPSTYTGVFHKVTSEITSSAVTLTVDGVTTTGTVTPVTLSTQTLPMFGGKTSNSSTVTNFCPNGTRCRFAKYYLDGVLARDYKPAVDENGVGFMFDKVSHRIYDNAGTGAFKYPDVLLEYLESTGTQYINTGYCPNAKTVLREKLRCFSTVSAGLSFTRWSGNPEYDTFAIYWAAPNGFNFYYGRFSNGKLLQKAASLDTDYEIEMGLTSITVNGVSTAITRGTTEWTNTSYPLYLFAGNNIGTTAYNSSCRKYFSQILEDGEFILDLIPVLHSGTACMYDRVSRTYFTNAGTGTFNFKIKEKQDTTYLIKDSTTKKTRLIEE